MPTQEEVLGSDRVQGAVAKTSSTADCWRSSTRLRPQQSSIQDWSGSSLLQLEIWWDFTKIFLIPWSHYFLFLPRDPDPDIAFLFCEEMSSFPSINLFLLQLMAPQEASWTQTNPRNQEDFWPRSEIWDFWKSVSSSSFWSVLGEEKVTQKLKTGDVVMILAMSVYLDFKKQILPTTIT